MSSRNAPAYCSTKPAAPPIPQAPSRSPTPAESAQDLEEVEAFSGAEFGVEAAEGFLLGDAAAAARRDERRAGVGAMVESFLFYFFDRRKVVRNHFRCPRNRRIDCVSFDPAPVASLFLLSLRSNQRPHDRVSLFV